MIARLGRRRRTRAAASAATRIRVLFGVWVAQEADAIRSVPIVDPTHPLRREHEPTICAHFGIDEGVGGVAETASRGEGVITATPPS